MLEHKFLSPNISYSSYNISNLVSMRLGWISKNQEAVIFIKMAILLNALHWKPAVEEMPSTLRKILIPLIGKISIVTKRKNLNLSSSS